MASAFDDIDSRAERLIRQRFLAGDTMAEIRREIDVSAKALRAMRDEVFAPLHADPQAVKDLANGPILNPLEVIRYRRTPGQRPRKARSAAAQIEMFSA